MHFEGLAADVYADARQPQDGDVFGLAQRLLGAGCVRKGAVPVGGPAMLLRAGERWCIVLDPRLSLREARFFVGHELAHWIAQTTRAHDDTEDAANALGAALAAPPQAVERAWSRARSPSALAAELRLSETASVLRVGEALDRRALVYCRTVCLGRGPSIARVRPRPRNVPPHAHQLSDARERFAVVW